MILHTRVRRKFLRSGTAMVKYALEDAPRKKNQRFFWLARTRNNYPKESKGWERNRRK